MIAPLRTRHRFFFVALAVIGVPLLALALSGRPHFPAQSLPEGVMPTVPEGGTTSRPFDGLDAELRVVADRAVLELAEPLRKPDVIAYWSAQAPAAGLPDDAYLLGPVSAARPNVYLLPPPVRDGASQGNGHWILYSLGHQEVVFVGAAAGPGETGGGA